MRRNRSDAERRHHRERVIRKRIAQIRRDNWLDPNGGRWNDWRQVEEAPAVEVVQAGRWAKSHPYTARMWSRDDWGNGPMGVLDRQRGQERDLERIHRPDVLDAFFGELQEVGS